MQQASLLELIAELGIAFAGFTGLVGAFRRNRALDERFTAEFRVLIEFSLWLVLTAVFPLFLWQMGLPEGSAWRMASLAHVGFNAFYYWRRFTSLIERAHASQTAALVWITLAIEASLGVLLLANGLGLLPWPPHIVYLLSLFYQLAGTSLSFMRLAAPLWSEPNSE